MGKKKRSHSFSTLLALTVFPMLRQSTLKEAY